MIKEYNPKIDLLVAKYTCCEKDINERSHLRLKEIYQEKILPNDKYEKNLLIIKR